MSRVSRFLLALAALLVLPACDSADAGDSTLYTAPQEVGDGTARLYVARGADGTPTALGIVLTATALDGLPTHGGGDGHTHDLSTVLEVPAAARAAGIVTDHVSLDWNPTGHEPEGLFTIPHFDVHFYTVPVAERMTWMPGTPGFEQGGTAPDARYVPAGYVLPAPDVVPMMGAHWLDAADPTYAPGGPAFTEVFIFGSYGGQMVFAEPMITRAYLQQIAQTGAVHQETLPQPQAYAEAGLYPTTYSVRYDATRSEYRIELGGLVRRSAS